MGESNLPLYKDIIMQGFTHRNTGDVVTAWYFMPPVHKDVLEWCPKLVMSSSGATEGNILQYTFCGSEHKQLVSEGNWIVKYSSGWFIVVNHYVFIRTYRAVV